MLKEKKLLLFTTKNINAGVLVKQKELGHDTRLNVKTTGDP